LKRKILIIGGSSLLSLNIVFFLKKKFSLYLACNSQKPKIPSVESFFINFNKIEEIKKKINIINPDIIFLSAALTNIEYCEKHKKKAYKVNYLLNKQIVDLVKKKPIKIIFISSDQVYSGKKNFSVEKDRRFSLNYYAKLKILSENYILKNFKKSLIIRTNFFGYGPNFRMSFSDRIMYNFKVKNKINYFKDVIFTPIYMPIFSRILLSLINHNISGVFNICGPDKISKYEFAKKIFEVFKFNKNYLQAGFIKNKTSLTKRPINMSMSSTKVSRYINFTIPKLHQQIVKMKNDYQSNYYFFMKKIKLNKKQ
jgi:dTDP-4-dehydrorhamnose reductase